jgi:cell division protein FtsQ
MDGRGRLAQSLKPMSGRTAFDAAPAAPAHFIRLRRSARRWLTPILELEPPQGIGALAVGALLAASSAYGVVRGGHVEDLTASLQNICDRAANSAGMQISSIALSGETQLSREDILTLAGVSGRSSLFCLDAAAARDKLKTSPWIADATVLKLYPGRLQIELKERSASALWQNAGLVSVIAADGTVLEPFAGSQFAALPLVVGEGAQVKAQDFLAMVGRYPVLRDTVEAAVLVADRRWNLRLKSGIDVRLPENNVEAALQTLMQLDRDKKLLSRDIAMIDLRLSDRVTVRLSDPAAQAREEAVKEMMKKEKIKKKGTDT